MATADRERLPRELEHGECDHPRLCMVRTGGWGPDGPLVDVSGPRDALLDAVAAAYGGDTVSVLALWRATGRTRLAQQILLASWLADYSYASLGTADRATVSVAARLLRGVAERLPRRKI
jgi:hypothetical protein